MTVRLTQAGMPARRSFFKTVGTSEEDLGTKQSHVIMLNYTMSCHVTNCTSAEAVRMYLCCSAVLHKHRVLHMPDRHASMLSCTAGGHAGRGHLW